MPQSLIFGFKKEKEKRKKPLVDNPHPFVQKTVWSYFCVRWCLTHTQFTVFHILTSQTRTRECTRRSHIWLEKKKKYLQPNIEKSSLISSFGKFNQFSFFWLLAVFFMSWCKTMFSHINILNGHEIRKVFWVSFPWKFLLNFPTLTEVGKKKFAGEFPVNLTSEFSKRVTKAMKIGCYWIFQI